MTKAEKASLHQVVYEAIESRTALIDAHRTELKRVGGKIVSVFPKCHKAKVSKWKRDIIAWRELLAKYG